MIAAELRGEDVLAPGSQVRFIQVSAAPFAGTTLAESAIAETTGCLVIAIEDDAGISSNPDPNRTLTGEERLTLVGSDSAVQTFLKEFNVEPSVDVEDPGISPIDAS